MKSSFLIAGIFCLVFCLVFSSAGTAGRRSQCNQASCRSNLMRRDEIDDQNSTDTDVYQEVATEGEPPVLPTPEGTEETSSEFSPYTMPPGEDGVPIATPTATPTTLWDDDGNAYVFPVPSDGNPVLSMPTPFTTWDDYGSATVITPTLPVKTLWNDDGNAVMYTPTFDAVASVPSDALPSEIPTPTDQALDPNTEIPVPTDQPLDSNTENPSPVQVAAENSDPASGNIEVGSEEQVASTTNQRMPVIIGGSVGALALVVGIGGFVGYRAVRNRRKSQWFKPEYKDTKGFFDLKEVAEIAAHSPGMNTPMPMKSASTPAPASFPSISHQPLASSPKLPSVPPLVQRNNTYNGLFVPSFDQPTRTSSQSSVGIRESALEETIIVGFSDFEENNRHRDSTNYRLSTSPSANTHDSSIVIEEPLFVMTALLPYMPQRPNEMLVQSGDEIVITEEVGEEWLGGYNKSRDPDTKGYFPRTCVTGSSYL
ncbi:hypothetical protein K493DRAFT_412160 [Basidiobolus meristosporus CBS 931.73]|uniref:SH3 domain-containing protein n=1 Tax=Basidiobolus meristosporus CBS 931.73 TaxID=1314790 RepID=A0A1Y1X4W2_9FUNG|nr:hypothetical protein K493DRAFT_412160 [Basidiobolus meristosporus CBS 931.73]|eukprot:ORX80354.1 hypothetical protein K493DRAFT_412160 [Basidiobolus meristosporus CBS 931.73]